MRNSTIGVFQDFLIFLRENHPVLKSGVEETMRTIILLICLSLTAFTATAQEQKLKRNNVPSAVLEAFKSAYPTATIRGYAREKENGKVFYEIESTDGNTRRDILYNADGSVEEIEETVPATALPSAALELLKTKYPKAAITRVEKVTDGDKVEFEVGARQGKKVISFVFDGDGKLLRSRTR